MPRKIFLIACEASGDLHGAHLVGELKKICPDMLFCGIGGAQMVEAGVRIFHDMTQISALGLGDVLRNYFKYRKIFYETLGRIEKEKPDCVILIDSPAFNLRLAKKISKKVPVIYYISPQLWAWGGRRIHVVRKHVHKMLVILPFEKELYQKAGVPCSFVGHPLLDCIPESKDNASIRSSLGIPAGQKAIGLFSGSRESEVRRILPIMLQAASYLQQDLPKTVFFLSRSPNDILKKFPIKTETPSVPFYDLVRAMDFALVTSGTATLETALLGTPFFLLYKTSWSTYLLGRHLIRVRYLGLVNLLAKKSVVPEFIQNDAHPETIAHEAKIFLKSPELQQDMRLEFLKAKTQLGEKGASRKAAYEVIQFLDKIGKKN